jgi:hypothetical protein
MSAIEDRHAVFLTSIIPRLDDLAPVMVSEHGRGFWTVLDPSGHGVDARVGFLPEGPGLAAFESPALAEVAAELLARYDPAYVPPPDLKGPFDATGDHLVVIFEGGAAYLYWLDGTEHATSPLLVLTPQCE